MEQILLNLANDFLIRFCIEHKINCSGTHVKKDGRGFSYSLVYDLTGEAAARVTFHKSSVPTFGWN